MANDDDNEQLFAAARERFGSEDYVKASKLLQQLLARDPSNAEARCWLGKSLSQRRRYAQAIPHLQEAIKQRADGADVHVELGKAYLAQAENEKELASARRQKFTLALAEFDSAVAAEPTRESAPSRIEAGLTAGKACMAKAESDRALYDKALAYFDAAIAADPTMVEAHLEAGRACLRKTVSDKAQYDSALAHFEAALEQAPGAEDVYDALEAVAAQFIDLEAVLIRWRKIVQRHKRPDAHLLFARLLWVLGKPEAALDQLLAAARLLERSNRDLMNTGSVDRFLFSLKRHPRTVTDPRSILAKAKRSLQRPRDPRSHALWASGLSLAGLAPAAMDYWRQALQQAPADTDCYELLWHVLDPKRPRAVRRDRPADKPPDQRAELVTTIQAVIDASDEPSAHLEWGRTLRRLRNHDAAAREFERSDLPAGYAEWATQLMRAGDADLAEQKLLHAFDLAEARGNADTLLAELQFDLGEAKISARLIDRIDALVERSTRPDLLGWWANVLARLDRPKLALRRIEDALRLGSATDSSIQLSALGASMKNDPALRQELISIVRKSRHPIYAELVDLLVALKSGREALDCCAAWTELEPENANAFRKLGQIHSNLKQFEQSVAAFKRATELNPGLGEAYTERLAAIGERDLEAGAVRKLISAFAGWSNGLDAAVDWQDVERLREVHVKAARELLREVESYVDSSYTYTVITNLLMQQGMFSEALQLLERTNQHWPELVDANLFYSWGCLLANVGDHKRAIIKLQRASALAPDWFYPYCQRAICHEERQQYRRAICAYSRALRKGTAFSYDDEVRAKADAYTKWARVLSSAGEYDEALEKSRLALEIKPSDYWSHFQRAAILAEMALHERALAEYDRATQIDTFPHAHHNMWELWEQQGHYGQARQKLAETRGMYQRHIAAKLRERDAYYCLYYSWACSADQDRRRAANQDERSAVDRAERRAEDLLRAAILFDSNTPDFQVSLAKLYLNRAKSETLQSERPNSGRADRLSAPAVPARLKAIEHYRKAERLLQRRLGFCRTVDTLLGLGELYLLNDEWDKAKTTFEEAIRIDPRSVRGRKGLAEALLKLGDAAAAVRHLGNAMDRAPTDLSVLLVHAQGCRRAEKLDEAEIGYQRVLEIAPCHVDARVGLGELYLDMADKRATQKNSTAVAELYTKAISCLSKAVDLFRTKDAPLTIATSLGSTYYQLGYAQVQLYEISVLRRDKSLVTQALRNFNACLARDKLHVKARRATESIREDQRGAKSRLESYAGPAIIVMALVVFVLAQFGLLVGRPIHAQDIMLTPASLARVKAAGFSDDLLGKLRQIESIAFETSDKLGAKAKELMGGENFSKLGTSVIENAERKKGELRFETIDLGSYALLTFGSLLLMMAGAFLPQLTSLKLAGLQLEKASAERIETKTALAIER